MTLDNVIDVQISREATVRTPTGGFFNAFQMHSYLAKVLFDDGEHVIVAMPKMAAVLPESRWYAKALQHALAARDVGMSVSMMSGSY